MREYLEKRVAEDIGGERVLTEPDYSQIDYEVGHILREMHLSMKRGEVRRERYPSGRVRGYKFEISCARWYTETDVRLRKVLGVLFVSTPVFGGSATVGV